MKYKFKKDFWFGAATSGPQTEGDAGKKNQSIMDYWYQQTPSDFYDQVGPTLVDDTYHEYKKDASLMKQINLNSFRTSIQWTRLYDDLEKETINEDAVKFYRNYFSEIKNQNIQLVVNLWHFDLPIIYEKNGGFSNKEVVKKYQNYAKKAFELFGDLVDYWTTFNEPIASIEACYLYQWHYPKEVNFKKAIQVGYGMILAHSLAVQEFHQLFKDQPTKKIGTILNLTPTYPKDDSKENIEAAKIRDLLFNRSFLDPMVKNEFPQELVELLKNENLLPEYSEEEINIIKNNKLDFLGVNYYQPARVQARTTPFSGQIMPEKWFENYVWPERRINPYRGWEIHPETIYEIAINIRDNYGNLPWYISENGMGVADEQQYRNEQGFIEDDYRIEFVSEHWMHLHKAIEEGSNCFGYHMWTFIDCWSWANAFKNRYGFVELNLETREKVIKKSGYWIAKVIEANEFEFN